MSDSDNELLTTNTVYPFQNESTTLSARGPNINTKNLTGLSFRNNVLTSTMNMPRNYEWQRRAESNFDQQSLGYRSETPPMSIASACDARHRKFNSSYNARGMSSQRSVYNGRGGSAMSMRSIDSNATMSATDIAMAFKTTQFNKYDMRIIKMAYNKFMKQKARKRIEKKRNLKLFLKGYRRKSGYDSGELGSNSSISSDDNRSTRTSNYKTNMSSCRSTKTDIADFRRTIKESNMFQDCTDNFRQNRMHGMLSKPANLNTSKSSVSSFRSMIEKSSTQYMAPPVNFNKTQSRSAVTQQDRFRNGFLLPSQRFNRSVAVSSIPEISEKPYNSQKNKYQNVKTSNRQLASPSKHPQELNSDDDDDEEIFPETITTEKSAINQRKRSLDSGDDYICLPVQKKPKVASPCKNMSHSFKNSTVIEKNKNDFQFAKPAFPVRKSANIKSKDKIIPNTTDISTTEKLISKSRAPFPDINILPPPQKQINSISQPKNVEEKGQTEKEDSIELSTVAQNTTDLSMRPSFIKRKLFTQNMDVTEKHSDNIAANSPQNSIYGAIQKEKNKARKLVTSQYCLSRDIQPEENNLLDLIHKIVPSEKMNATNQTTKTAVQNNKSEDSDDKWDITSIISTRNNDENVSDTFTDEDTILCDGGKQSSPKVTDNMVKKSPHKKVEKLPSKVAQVTQRVLADKNGTPKKKVQKYVKTFWDTDFESDAEGTPALRKEELKENKRTENIMQSLEPTLNFQGFSSMFPAHKTSRVNYTTTMNNTVDSTHRFNITNKSFRICSHRNNKPTKTVQEKITYAKPSIEQQSKNSKTAKASYPEISIRENKQIQSEHENPKHEASKAESKKSPPKKRKTKKDIPIENKKKEPIKKQTSDQEQTLKSDEKVKSQKNKPVSVHKNPPKIKEMVQNKPQNNQKSSTTQNKNETKASENKTGKNTRTTKCNTDKPQNNKTSVTSNKTQNNTKVKDQKANSTLLDTTVSKMKNNRNPKNAKNKNVSKLSDSLISEESFAEPNNNRSIRPVRVCRKLDTTVSKMKNNKNPKNAKNKNVSKLSDSLISEESFAEPNNNRSIRPVRACRNSKENKTHDTTNNLTLSRSLRSREVSLSNNIVAEETKPKAKVSKKTKATKSEQSILSDLSFSIAQDNPVNKKPLSSLYNTRLFKTKDIDISDVSFSINNDKDSPLPKTNQRNSAKCGTNTKFMKQALICISPIGKKVNYSLIEQRSVRNKLPNRRYVY